METGRQLVVPSGYSEHPIVCAGSIFRLAWSRLVPADGSAALVLPDGAVDIVWLGDELVVAGPSRAAHLEHVTPGSTVTGLRFSRGAASAWLGVGMQELVDVRVPLHEIVGRRRAAELAEPFHAIADSGALVAAMKRAVVGSVDPVNAYFARVVIEAVASANADAVILAALQATGLTERTLRRRCDRVFGYGPRTLSRILRLQRLLALIEAEPSLSLAAAAAAVGYADQPHMTRETRALTTMSPAALATRVLRPS